VKSNLGASIRARLLTKAKAEGSDFNQMLVRFALERFLYRISQSAHAEFYILKGALLFTLWYDMPHRTTRDADLLGFGASDLVSVKKIFQEISGIKATDGIEFFPDTVTVEEIRKDAGYGGVRVLINATIDGARCKTQVDIGFGDAVTPSPIHANYPTLIEDLPAPKLRTYPIYTVVAEKFHAIALLGMANTRMKDYFDLHIIFSRENLNIATLAQAIKATFARRGMELPNTLPLGLTDEFANDPVHLSIWAIFIRKNELVGLALSDVVEQLKTKFEEILNIK
jgi:hypothetical protein